MNYYSLLENLTERNCNAKIEKLQILQNDISRRYRIRYNNGITSVEDLDEEYGRTCDVMRELCSFRSSHNCLLRGDPGFQEA